MIQCQLPITNRLGLHARAATKLASSAGQYSCSIKAGVNGKLVDAKSVMALMLLAAGQGTVLNFEFNGADERKAHKAISALLGNRFGEEQ